MVAEIIVELAHQCDLAALENLAALDDQKLLNLWGKYKFVGQKPSGELENIKELEELKAHIINSEALSIKCSIKRDTCFDLEAQTKPDKRNWSLSQMTSGKYWIFLSLMIATLFTSAVIALSIVIIQGDAPAMTREMEAGSIFTLSILGLATFALFMVACTMKLWNFLGLLSLGYVSLLAAGLMAHLF